ncbi:PQQ-dependent sugar dehydrogenase [Nonomuraea sp. B12E4]|uniref:PQQ-dependent sugar dehydrogenase n=1 Tax=Nonomuraea sp. B12E4 TaxID=3153564 RepID=UPI00325EDCF8
MRRLCHALSSFLLLSVGLVALASPPARALPASFQKQTVFSGLNHPSNIEFSPDGRVFVAEKNGLIKVFDSLTDTTPATYADLRTQVHNFWDRGLLGLALHPDFPADPRLYVMYAYDALPGGTAPRWGTPGGTDDPCPTPPGATGDGCLVTGRLSVISPSGAETPLITDWCQQHPSHSTGDLEFARTGCCTPPPATAPASTSPTTARTTCPARTSPRTTRAATRPRRSAPRSRRPARRAARSARRTCAPAATRPASTAP